ncbi:hypothetical protein VNO80_28296 [Phaseolus coccineus]|uniref:Uncharacterized protein n=1 Tax=Phaseolus coccineus TaxID=3886 RepID=A0AAN9L8T0_PHACN
MSVGSNPGHLGFGLAYKKPNSSFYAAFFFLFFIAQWEEQEQGTCLLKIRNGSDPARNQKKQKCFQGSHRGRVQRRPTGICP